jgi:tetratricopeptide (TPR) repeat protein
VQRAGSDTAALLTRWIDARAGEPFFAFLHLYEPHTPYTPPEPFASRYREHPYDGEIAAADATLGSFLAHLKETGVYDRAIVVLLSDHGEGLGEHGEDEHGVFLYRASLQVPLLLKLPKARRGGTVVNEPAQLADVTPTLEALTGAAHAAEGAPTLLTLAAAGERSIFSETLYPRLHLGWSDLRSFIAGNAHYIEAPRAEFYDVAADPSELHDLAPQKPDRFRRLRVAMETRPVSFAAPDASDKEEVARLAALGYVTAAPPAAGALPDPKDRIETVRALKASFGDFTLGRYEAAAEGFRKLLAENPRMTDVWEAYSDTLVRMGRAEDALLALKKGVESSPNAPTSLLLPIAELDLRLGRLDEARRNAEAARAAGNPGADDVLSRVFLAQKDWTKAEAAATAALAARGSVRAPYLTLARVAMARGDLAGALARLDELERRTKEHRLGPMSSAHFLRGDVLARLERPREAEAEFLAEIRLFPHNVEARSSLAMLYASEGRLPDLRRAIDDLVRANPVAASYDTAVRILGIVGDRDGVRAVEAARRRAVNGCSRFQTPTVAAASSSATLGIPLLVNVAAGKPDGGGHIER